MKTPRGILSVSVIPFTSTNTENDGMTANRATRNSRTHVDGANRLHHKKHSCGEDLNTPGEKTKKKKVLDFSRTSRVGGRNRTRIS